MEQRLPPLERMAGRLTMERDFFKGDSEKQPPRKANYVDRQRSTGHFIARGRQLS
jgi:hypothetical protein